MSSVAKAVDLLAAAAAGYRTAVASTDGYDTYVWCPRPDLTTAANITRNDGVPPLYAMSTDPAESHHPQ